MSEPLRILHLEDNANDAELVRELLLADGLACTIERVEEEKTFVAALAAGGWDIVLSDFNLPMFDGLSALAIAREKAPHLPFVLISGSLGEEAAVESVRRGATDYILKDNLTRLPTSVRRALAEAAERRRRREAETGREESRERYRRLVELSPDALFILHDERVVFVNAAAVLLLRAEHPAQLVGKPLLDRVHAEDVSALRDRIAGMGDGGTMPPVAARFLTVDGSGLEVELVAAKYATDGQFEIQVIARDVSQRNQLERQVRQGQKMEAIGSLASGVAHDFNNLLTPILGYSQVLRLRLAAHPDMLRQVGVIEHAARRASDLTRQLLAFSRQQPLEPQVLDLNAIVTAMEPLLRRLIGAHIEVCIDLGDDLGRVEADPTRIEQIVLNLAVNAQDAMPQGGVLRIGTRNAAAPPRGAASGEGPSGPCVVLSVADTGSGMDADLQSRIYDPFFTTKDPGKGTGLGLSTVLGIVQQAGGVLELASAPGAGTTFEAFLPRCAADASATEVAAEAPAPRTGGEAILVVEDDELVRSFATEALAAAGYAVVGAADAVEALRALEAMPGTTELLLSDVVLPRTSGPDLVRQVLASQPAMRVLFMSGYSAGSKAIADSSTLNAPLLQKPFTVDQLLHAVRDSLDAPRRAAA